MNIVLAIIAFLLLMLVLVEWARLRATRQHVSVQTLIRGDIAVLSRDVKTWLARKESKIDGGTIPPDKPA